MVIKKSILNQRLCNISRNSIFDLESEQIICAHYYIFKNVLCLYLPELNNSGRDDWLLNHKFWVLGLCVTWNDRDVSNGGANNIIALKLDRDCVLFNYCEFELDEVSSILKWLG